MRNHARRTNLNSAGLLGAALLPLPALLMVAGANAQAPLCPVRQLSAQFPQASVLFGFSVAGLGDVNGDGFADFAVGAPGTPGLGFPPAANAGRLTIHDGWTASVLFTSASSTGGDQFGFSVARLGDVNGGGVPDFVVGSPGAAPGGRAYVVAGETNTSIHVLNGTTGAEFGYSVAGIGDLDGNNVPDVLVGAPGAQRAFAFDGQTGNPLWGGPVIGNPCSFFGRVVEALGDLDGDGIQEVAVGSPFNCACSCVPGQVHIFSGFSGSPLSIPPSPPLTNDGVIQASFGWTFGSAVARLEDVNADSIPDLAVALPELNQVEIRSGADESILDVLPGSSFLVGTLANVCDVNGDGLDDLMVGASPSGEATVWSPASLPAQQLFRFPGTLGAGGTGDPVAVAGSTDEDGNGLTDVLAMGASNAMVGVMADAGRASVLSIGVPLPNGSGTFGTGCNASGGAIVPGISVLGGLPLANTGNPATGFLASKVRGGTLAVFLFGFSNSIWSMGPGGPAVALPASLAALGLGGCTLAVAPDFFFYVPTTGKAGLAGDGVAYVATPCPMDPSLVGMHVYGQWYVVDPGPNAIPGSMSDAVDLVL
ncbi:MAG: integrin alpha [Planctomycetes bacterium]|nr:integrin alpha [Planctomycetota bacterium]